MFNTNILQIISVSKSVADTLLKYRCIWDNEEPILTDTPPTVDSPNDITTSESKGTALLPDSSMFTLFLFLALRKIRLLNKVNFNKKLSMYYFYVIGIVLKDFISLLYLKLLSTFISC